jgi:hypothetical protein
LTTIRSDVPFSFAGIYGLTTITIDNWDRDIPQKPAAAVGGAAFLVLCLLAIYTWWYYPRAESKSWPRVVVHLALQTIGIMFMFAIYTDLLLGFATDHILGAPYRGREGLFVIYFALKRLPMLTSSW